jgi:tetratricopeptide (TPR) repeat protein
MPFSSYFYGNMQVFKLFIVLLFSGFSLVGYTQDNLHESTQQGIYTDRITDENGNPLANIKIQVQGKNIYTYSDGDGYFSIKAHTGDVIVLSKNGIRINSYRLDGSNDYKVEDQSESVVSERKFSNSISKKRIANKHYLDSANYYLHKDAYKSIDFIELQLQSDKKPNTKNFIRIYTLLGDNYMQLKQYDLAVSNYEMALQKTNDAAVQIKLAQALFNNKKYNKSIDVFQKINQKKISNWQLIEINEGLGNNAFAQNKNDFALNHYKKALTIASQHKITPKITELNTKIADILSVEGKKKEADIYIQKSLENTKSEHLKKRAKVQNQVADIYQLNQDFDNEIQLRKQTLNELEEANLDEINIESDDNVSPSNLSTSQLNLDIGKAYLNKNEFKKAIPYLEKSALKAEELKDLETQKNAVQKLSELYKKIGNSKKALQKYQEYAGLVDRLYQQKEKEIQDIITLNNQLREKQNRINSLEKDRELSESRLQLSQSEKQLSESNYKRQRLLIYALLIGILLFSIALYAMYRSNKQRQLANNLLALKSLRSQMNPHFIFNALNSVNSFIAQNDERTANRYLTDFSTLMRNVLNNSEQDFIPLDKEIELLHLYLQLEHSRFQDKFDYKIDIDDKIPISQFQIPPMLLQPYVENAVWHGLRYKKEKGKLHIKFQQKDAESISITITDNGIGRKKSKELKTQNQKKQQSKGMNNIKKRIQILNEMYSNKVDVSINDLYEDGSGTKVVLTLKKD